MILSIHSASPVPTNRSGPALFLRRLFLLVLVLSGTALGLSAGEIIAYQDSQGRRVYINSDDAELKAAAHSGGISAALRVIEQRKRALPNLDQYIEDAANRNRLDPKLLNAVIEVESGWNSQARSRKGAMGLMQLMPETAARFGVSDPFDPKQNIEGGARYLRFLLDRFEENIPYTLAAYNAGETIVTERGGIPPYEETRAYLQRVRMLLPTLQQDSNRNRKRIDQRKEGGRTVYTNLD